jgi:rubrerythrin
MVKSKKMSVLVLAVFLFAVFAGFKVPKASAAAVPSDIFGSWAYSQISDLISQGGISGYPDGTFKPDNSVTRAEFISMINKAFHYNTTAAISFSDVSPGDWFYNDIAKATVAGYISDYPDGTMKPENAISRAEAASIIMKLDKLTELGAPVVAFKDAASFSWSKVAIEVVTSAKIMNGYPDSSFKPANNITRGEAVIVLDQALTYNSLNDKVMDNSLNDKVMEAMKAERHDRVKYQRMMEMTTDPAVIKQIKFAYDDEIKHYGMFQQIYYQLTGEKLDIPIPTNIEKYNTLMEAVQSSIEGENEAVDLYRENFALMTNEQMRDKVFEIITDEQEHFGRFIYLYSMLK